MLVLWERRSRLESADCRATVWPDGLNTGELWSRLVDRLETWLEQARQDADRRQLPALRPLLETLSRATSVLRGADWNLDATDHSVPLSGHVR